jgi:NAD(P)-dependent dehydrogenase (short-subunit alcohol dehydrogenase family)
MIKGKSVILIGACGLLGKHFSNAILENNASILLADINEDHLKSLYSELIIKFPNSNIDFYVIDITSKNSIIGLINKYKDNNKTIDAIVNSAYPKNKNFGRHFFEVEFEDFTENISLHLGGYFLTSQLFAKYFIDNKIEGNIINISSIYGVIPPRFEIYNGTKMSSSVEYAAIKSGLIHLSKYIAKYLKSSGVRINCISPGGIFDNQPVTFLQNYKDFCLSKGMLNPNDITGTIIFLLSDNSKFINGQNIIVDDGFVL